MLKYIWQCFYSLAETQCYTEDDVKYNIDNLGNTEQLDSMEDCRTYCRHINTFTFISSLTLKEGSDCSNICLSRDTYQEAEYFTYNQNNNNCNCKPDINLDDTRESINTQISGNVNCEFILPRIFKSREYPIWQCVLLSRSRKMLYRGWCKIPCRNRWPDQP